MKCPKCGQSLPDDSVFCQFCGCTLGAASSPTPIPKKEIISSRESAVSTQSIRPSQESKVKTTAKVLTVILLILFLLSAGLNVYQYSQNNALKKEYSEISRHAAIEEQLVEQKDQKIRQLQTIPEYYNFLFSFFHTRDFYNDFTGQKDNPLGYASENFKVETNSGILSMYVGEEKKLSLISYDQNISIDDSYYAGLTNPISWSFAEYTFNGSRTIELSAVSPGVQVLCFTNGTSNESFDLIIIVN